MQTGTVPSQWHGESLSDIATVIAVIEDQNKQQQTGG